MLRRPDSPAWSYWRTVLGAGAVMMVTSALLTLLTVTLPGEWTPLRWALLGAGFVFALAYAVLLVASRRT